MAKNKNSVHWADAHAQKIIQQKGPKQSYTCASGITPSGTVHIGNFREIISVDLVVRALRDAGEKVRFIYSWDEYDVFRKVPKNMPRQEELKSYLRWPITKVPDPFGEENSYARRNEKELEKQLPRVGITPEYIYQAGMYQKSAYAEGIKTALEHRDLIRSILDRHRKEPLPENWWPISIFSTFTNRDDTEVLDWDGEYGVRYRCKSTENEETLDIRKTGAVKLLWRIDWPMRWKYEAVDFEPAGKEHHSAGGSFDTAKEISKKVYGFDAPVTFKYDFISIKGMGGKISSSLGNVVSLEDALQVYQPEIVRYLFASTRPNAEFAVSFDLDVLKIYEDYDRCERIYFGVDEVGEKRREKEKRNYELSQTGAVPAEIPFQVPFRHLCNLLQINGGNIEDTIAGFGTLDSESGARLKIRAECAWYWINKHAPEDFRFHLKAAEEEMIGIGEEERRFISALADHLEPDFDSFDEKSLGELLYSIAGEHGLEPKDMFTLMYRLLIGKKKGPRLAGFILTAGKDRIIPILKAYQ